MNGLNRHILTGILFALASSPVLASSDGTLRSEPVSCELAASNISTIPSGLLGSIGLVESGHIDEDGHVRAWPYTVDVDGNGYWFVNAAAAIRFTENAIQNNYRSIDVGCFQINLQSHPNAFASLQAAFSPKDNAEYAAKYLQILYNQYGNWAEAVGAYHSGNVLRAAAYLKAVMATWNGQSEQQTYFSFNNIQQNFTGQWVAMNQYRSSSNVRVFYGISRN